MKYLLITSLFLILLLSVTTIIMAEEIETITAIEITGNAQIREELILAEVMTEVGDILSQDNLRADLEAVYELGFFQDARILFESYQGGVKVIFELQENPVIEKILIEGNQIYPTTTLLNLMDTRAGDVLNPISLNTDLEKILTKYHDDGYINFNFTDIDFTSEGILKMIVSEGYLNDIRIEGNTKTKDKVILRELDFNEGQFLNIKEIEQAYHKIFMLNLFEDLDFQLDMVDVEENKTDLVIKLKETQTGTLNLGGGYSSQNGLFGFTSIQERNFLGNGQTIGLDWQFGGVTNFSLKFFEPWLLGHPLSFGIDLYNTIQEGTIPEKGDYNDRRYGGNISLGYPLIKDWNGRLRFKLEETDWQWDDPNLDDDRGSTRSLTFLLNRNLTNHPFNPTKGELDNISVEYAGGLLGGDNNFTKYNFDLRRFYPGFKEGQAWAVRLKTGIGDGVIPETDKYRIGGSETLRGYSWNDFSGDHMVLLNLEYRFPITDNFRGAFFIDGGNAWEQLNDLNLGDLNYGFGAGVSMNTPIGQIRLDYGFNQEGQGMPHFSIGTAF